MTLALPDTSAPLDQATRRGLTERQLTRRALQSDTTGRRRFGAATDMLSIASAIENANMGLMVDMTDLATEVMALDPHLASCASKRFGALQAADWDVTPPQGLAGRDREYAAKIATEVHDLLERLSISDVIFDLAWGLYDGRAASEVQWAEGAWGHKIAPYAVDWVHPRRLAFGAYRELRVIDPFNARPFDSTVGVGVEDQPGKFLFWKPRLFREYAEREGLALRSFYWAFFKRFGWRLCMRLQELCAIPWRVVEVDGETPANPESITDARKEADELSGDVSAVMPQGTKLNVEWPGERSGELFGETHDRCNGEISKVWLGNTATTQQGEGARAEGIIGKGEQDIVFQRDGNGASRRLDPMIRTFVRLNHGNEAAIRLLPKFQLRTQPPRDRQKEGERMKLALSVGITIPESEAREAFGIRPPLEDEKFLRMGAGGTDAFGNPTSGKVELVDPTQTTSDGEPIKELVKPDVTMAPTDLAVVITVNEARASAGLPPLDGPDGDLTLAEFKARHAETIAAGEAATTGKTLPTPSGKGSPQVDDVASSDPREPTAERAEDDVEDRGVDGQAEDAVKSLLGLTRHACAADHIGKTVPAAAVYGSPEVLVERGVREGARATTAWASAITSALQGQEDAVSIRRTLDRLALDPEPFARAVEKRIVHGAMLGALDADWEAENDRVVKPPAFAITNDGTRIEETEEARRARYGILTDGALKLAGGGTDFVATPFLEAIKIFRQRNVVTRKSFDRLQAQAKQRAFTVANMASTDVIAVVKDELVKALEEGDDLRRFSARAGERMEIAGWVRENPSHVETVFRTNTMGAYSRGREEQMNQPSVIAARPFRQAMGVKDTRTRIPHRLALGKVIRHDDPSMARLRTPWGFNCRCRWVSRSAADVERLGLEVVSGASLGGLPDEGWDGPGGF